MGKIVQTAGRNALGDLPYEEEAMRAHAKEMVFPIGAPNDGFAQYFSGRSFLAPISTSQVGIFNVTFEPGCSKLAHLAIEVPGENGSNEWLEPVSDEEYGKL